MLDPRHLRSLPERTTGHDTMRIPETRAPMLSRRCRRRVTQEARHQSRSRQQTANAQRCCGTVRAPREVARLQDAARYRKGARVQKYRNRPHGVSAARQKAESKQRSYKMRVASPNVQNSPTVAGNGRCRRMQRPKNPAHPNRNGWRQFGAVTWLGFLIEILAVSSHKTTRWLR